MACVCSENCVIDREKVSDLLEQLSGILADMVGEEPPECRQIRTVSALISEACGLLSDMKEEIEGRRGEAPPSELYRYVACKLKRGHCDGTLKYTKEWLCKNIPGHAADVLQWLENYGALCDCEVLLNASWCN